MERETAENRCFEIGYVWMQGCQTCLENKVRADEREQIVRDVAIHVAVLESERDAARAEVAALKQQIAGPGPYTHDPDTGKRIWLHEPEAYAERWENRDETRREVLADLRAKVEGLRDSAEHAKQVAAADGAAVLSIAATSNVAAYERVLALIEEAGR